MAIRDSTAIPPYKAIFDPVQLEMEAHIANLLKNNFSPDLDVQRVLARVLVKVVLGEFRPDLFEGYSPKNPEPCSRCGGFLYDIDSVGWFCPRCNGTGMEPE